MQFSKFVVDETPWCIFDWDLENLNSKYLDNINPDYLNFLREIYAGSFDDGNETDAALALRTAYSHGVETFLAFLFATFQAPDCVIGWMHRYEIYQLRNILRKIEKYQPFLTKIDLSQPTWDCIANTVLPFSLEDKVKEKRIKSNFALIWKRFGDDLLNPSFQSEYNSIKHGLRLRSGGFRISLGAEDTPGIHARQEKMTTLGSSEFGSSFYNTEWLGGEQTNKKSYTFRLVKTSVNWKPEKFVLGLQLLSLSLENVLSFIKSIKGYDPKTLNFAWPDNETWFSEFLCSEPTLSGMSFKRKMSNEQLPRFSKEEILSVYKRNSAKTIDSTEENSR